MVRLCHAARHLFRGIMGSMGVLSLLVLVGCGAPAGQDDRTSATYEPTPPHIQDVGEQLVGPIL